MEATDTAQALLGVDDRRVPATILTGFLGSGKTTLLNRILAANTGMRIAIIVNEIGDVGIDGGLIEQTRDDEVMELTAGCICCTIRGDLLIGIQRILERPEPPEYLIIETSGIADPLPVAQTMFLPYLRQAVRLDSIITVVDAEQFHRQLGNSQMVGEQLEFANIIVLSKVDLVTPETVQAVEATIREMNPFAPILHNANGTVDLRALLDVGVFRIDERFVTGAETWLEDEQAHHRRYHGPAADCDTGHDHDHDHGHLADEEIGTVSFITREPFAMEKLEAFWNGMGENVFRGKGVLYLADYDLRCVFHQVGARVTVEAHGPWPPDAPKESRLVFIGRHLDAEAMRAQLRSCLASAERARKTPAR